MNQLSDFAPLPREILKEGLVLKMNVYILLPQNESIIHFRKINDMLSADDVAFFSKVNPAHVLLPKSELSQLYAMSAEALDQEIKKGDLSSPALKQTAASVLNTIGDQGSLSSSMDGVGKLVQDLISQFKSSPSVSAYDGALKRAAANSNDPLTTHHQQVSSIVVLMALTVGNFSMDDLSDLAAAGLIHDLGLGDVTKSLIDWHLKETKALANSEKLVYMRHIDLTLERAKHEKLRVTPGMQRIIELHHENWNGTGFKGYSTVKIFRPARLLRIADDLVILVQDPAQKLNFRGALELLSKNSGMYDPEMLSSLLANVK